MTPPQDARLDARDSLPVKAQRVKASDMKKARTQLPAVKIWEKDIGEASRGPVAEPVPKSVCDGLLIGLLETGTVKALYRGETHTLRRGTLILGQPDETVAFAPAGHTSGPIRICLRCRARWFRRFRMRLRAEPPLRYFFRISSLMIRSSSRYSWRSDERWIHRQPCWSVLRDSMTSWPASSTATHPRFKRGGICGQSDTPSDASANTCTRTTRTMSLSMNSLAWWA